MKYSRGTASLLGRAISAEVRARLAAEKINLRDFSQAAGFASHNYPSIRLRDERPFTVDDVELIADYFEEDPHDFVTSAWENHHERLFGEQLFDRQQAEADLTPPADLSKHRKREAKPAPAQPVKRAARKTTKPKKP